MLLVILAVAALSLGLTQWTHASVPQNDDWSYIRSALALHRTGEIRLQGWGQMFLLGQLVTAQPFLAAFGARVASLNLYGVTMTGVWMWCAFVLARRRVGSRRGVLLVGTLALWPGLALLASSFMTDMPANAMALLTVVLGVRAVEGQSRVWLLLALTTGVFAFTIREEAVAGVGAVLIATLLSGRSSRRFRLEALGAGLLAALLCVVLEHVRHGLLHADLPPFGLHPVNPVGSRTSLLRVPSTLGLDLSPLVVWAVFSLRGRGRWLDPARVWGWLVGVAAVVGVVLISPRALLAVPRVLLGNYAAPGGAFSVATVGYAPPVSESAFWNIAQVTAAVCGVLLVGELGACLARVRRTRSALRTADPAMTMLGAYAALVAVATVTLSLGGQVQVDRYQVALLPVLGVLLLAVPRLGQPHGDTAETEGRRGADPRSLVLRLATVSVALLLAGLLAAISVTTAIATDVRDHNVWATATWLNRQGVPATHINAGLDWNGFHATVPLDRLGPDSHGYRGQHWMYLFPGATDCFVVAAGAVNRSFMVLLHQASGAEPDAHVYVYRNKRCRTLPASESAGDPA